MNRLLAFLSPDGSNITEDTLTSCPFRTPHWHPDHQAVYTEGTITMSATQRFITPQCQYGLMPYQHKPTGCVINADVYLTHRETLCQLLGKEGLFATEPIAYLAPLLEE